MINMLKVINTKEFHILLLKIDQEIAEEVKSGGCKYCPGVLDTANYERKPRGIEVDIEGLEIRFSYCCREEGCRKRHTPESVRFLGRKVYYSVVIMLACIFYSGLSVRRLERINQYFGVSPQTLARWRKWWLEAFKESWFFKAKGGVFKSPVNTESMPDSLFERFYKEKKKFLGLVEFLKFMAPCGQKNQGI
jgi:hypothetical protein